MTSYPRDMTGYGPTPPDAQWPNGARIAVQIVLNYEEGGENNILHGDAASEAFLSEIVGAAAWPGQRHWNMESIYEYGARAGFWRLHRLLKNIPLTVYGVATALARAPEQVAAMQEAGWEIASHGLKWIEHKDMSEQEERSQIRDAIALHTEVTGAPPVGWYTGRCSMNTVRLASDEGDFQYISDSYADDLPYWIKIGGRDQLIVPYTLDCNDMRFATPQGFNSGDQFESYLRDSFDVLYQEGGRMLSIGLHCRLIGRPGRAAALKRMLDYMAGHHGVWFATRQQIAEHWAKTHPAPLELKPSELGHDQFVADFGSVFENSAWVAEAAAPERGPSFDTATGVHALLVRQFRKASDDQRLAVLNAHPDLAGKLAQAQRLTSDSTSEQASAGLDMLTDDERTIFSKLNGEYTQKFGFPFIIAVRDHTKSSILAQFQERLSNSKSREFTEACKQVERIASLRLKDKFK
ncbi:MAG: allantoinase PuuE [Pseudoprimorskyibacter sp.]|nr:allantoinase PuuE [Pseudoprimorskyibacter sp.]